MRVILLHKCECCAKYGYCYYYYYSYCVRFVAWPEKYSLWAVCRGFGTPALEGFKRSLTNTNWAFHMFIARKEAHNALVLNPNRGYKYNHLDSMEFG